MIIPIAAKDAQTSGAPLLPPPADRGRAVMRRPVLPAAHIRSDVPERVLLRIAGRTQGEIPLKTPDGIPPGTRGEILLNMRDETPLETRGGIPFVRDVPARLTRGAILRTALRTGKVQREGADGLKETPLRRERADRLRAAGASSLADRVRFP